MSNSVTINLTSLQSSTRNVSSEAIQQEWQEIQLAQTNPSAFRPLYNRYYEPVFRFIYRRTSEQNLAADICSEVFFKAMQKLPAYQFRGVPFSAWLFRIATNEITQHFRNSQKIRTVQVETTTLPNLMEEIGVGQEDSEETVQKVLLPALNQLKIKDLELIEMRYFEQRPFKEIADTLEISESSCKMRVYRILERLKKIIINKK